MTTTPPPSPSAASHTPGPLVLGSGDLEHPYYLHVDDAPAGFKLVACVCSPNAKPNADRLAACWNACEGINPAAVPDLLAALHSAKESLKQLVTIGRIPANNAGLRDVRAALAKAETGA